MFFLLPCLLIYHYTTGTFLFCDTRDNCLIRDLKRKRRSFYSSDFTGNWHITRPYLKSWQNKRNVPSLIQIKVSQGTVPWLTFNFTNRSYPSTLYYKTDYKVHHNRQCRTKQCIWQLGCDMIHEVTTRCRARKNCSIGNWGTVIAKNTAADKRSKS